MSEQYQVQILVEVKQANGVQREYVVTYGEDADELKEEFEKAFAIDPLQEPDLVFSGEAQLAQIDETGGKIYPFVIPGVAGATKPTLVSGWAEIETADGDWLVLTESQTKDLVVLSNDGDVATIGQVASPERGYIYERTEELSREDFISGFVVGRRFQDLPVEYEYTRTVAGF